MTDRAAVSSKTVPLSGAAQKAIRMACSMGRYRLKLLHGIDAATIMPDRSKNQVEHVARKDDEERDHAEEYADQPPGHHFL